MREFVYITGNGIEKIDLSTAELLVGMPAIVKGHAWNYSLTARNLTNVNRTASEVELPFSGTYEAVSKLRRAADYDVSTEQHGELVYDGWHQRAYISGIEYDRTKNDRCKGTLKAVLLDACWWQVESVSFVIVEDIDSGAYLDYPHGYEYDYGRPAVTGSVSVESVEPCPVRLVIFGPAFNPYVIIGPNRYQVNATVPDGARVEVDGMQKTITMVMNDGSTVDCFGLGVRSTGEGGGAYVFENITPGENAVAWDNSFGFDLGWYQTESEPPWKL